MQAYIAVAAGLLLGSGGEMFFCLAGAGLVAAGAAWKRSIEIGALACLTIAGAVTGWSTATADEACANALGRQGFATTRPPEAEKPRQTARGTAVGGGSRA